MARAVASRRGPRGGRLAHSRTQIVDLAVEMAVNEAVGEVGETGLGIDALRGLHPRPAAFLRQRLCSEIGR